MFALLYTTNLKREPKNGIEDEKPTKKRSQQTN